MRKWHNTHQHTLVGDSILHPAARVPTSSHDIYILLICMRVGMVLMVQGVWRQNDIEVFWSPSKNITVIFLYAAEWSGGRAV